MIGTMTMNEKLKCDVPVTELHELNNSELAEVEGGIYILGFALGFAIGLKLGQWLS